MDSDYMHDLAPTLQWIDAFNDHAAAHPESRLHRMKRNDDGTMGRPEEDVYGWRSVLVANRDAGDHLPAPWRRIYPDMMLVAFDNDPTLRATWVGERHACLHVEWSRLNGLNVDIEMERRSRTTCPICGSPARTVSTGPNSAVTRCKDHLQAI